MAKKLAANLAKNTLTRQLRNVIESRGLSCTELGKMTGVDPSVISRFLSGEREIRIGTVDKFFEAFNLRIVETADRPRGKRS